MALPALFAARRADAAPIKLLALGDSLTAGYGLPHAEGFVAQLEAALHAHGVAAVVIDPAATEANLAAILDTLAARHIPALLCGMYAPPNLGADYAAAFRAVFDRLARRPGLLYDPFFLAGVAGDPALNQADGIHPTARGVAIIVARLLPLVERLISEASGP